jgi:hypothetical protein
LPIVYGFNTLRCLGRQNLSRQEKQHSPSSLKLPAAAHTFLSPGDPPNKQEMPARGVILHPVANCCSSVSEKDIASITAISIFKEILGYSDTISRDAGLGNTNPYPGSNEEPGLCIHFDFKAGKIRPAHYMILSYYWIGQSLGHSLSLHLQFS